MKYLRTYRKMKTILQTKQILIILTHRTHTSIAHSSHFEGNPIYLIHLYNYNNNNRNLPDLPLPLLEKPVHQGYFPQFNKSSTSSHTHKHFAA